MSPQIENNRVSNADLYDRLRRQLVIDQNALDEALIAMPTLLHEAIECATTSASIRDEAKRNVDYSQAAAAMRIRQHAETTGRKPAETQISQMIQLDQDFIDAAEAYDAAKNDLGFWQAMVSSMEAKQTSLKGLVNLANIGYFTVNSQADKGREELARKRKQLRGNE